jgi:hypothetical protein
MNRVCRLAMAISPENERLSHTNTPDPTTSAAGKLLSWLFRKPSTKP